MRLELNGSPEEIKIFLDEVDEHLQVLEEDLLKIEREGKNSELIQEIFRAAHTLKGSSATIGHLRMTHVTHAMENVLDKIRKDQLDITSELIDLLFEALDCLRGLKEEAVAGAVSDLNIEEIVAKLQQAAEGESGQEGDGEEVEERIDETLENLLKEEEIAKVREAISKTGGTPLRVMIKFDSNCEMLSVRAFITLTTLGDLGFIVRSTPSEEEIEKDKVSENLEVILVSNKHKNEIASVVKDLPDVVNVEITALEIEKVEEEESGKTEEAKAGKEKSGGGKNNREGRGRAGTGRTVRVDVELLDNLMNLVGELVIDRTRLMKIWSLLEANEQLEDIAQDLGRTSIHIGRVTSQLQEQIMKARMLPVESLFNKFPRLVRDLARNMGKEVEFIMEGQETELDRSIIEEIGDPLIHLLRNAVDHGIEPPEERVRAGKDRKGTILLKAAHEENYIVITVKDDGRGIDPERVRNIAIQKKLISPEHAQRMSEKDLVNLIFMPGLSTAQEVTDVSGRGVGMDVVKNNIEKINGSIEIFSELGKGTEFRIKLPLTLAIIRALLVGYGNNVYAIPLNSVVETLRLNREAVEKVNNQDVVVVRGKVLRLVNLANAFKLKFSSGEKERIFVVVANAGGEQFGIKVDYLIGEQEIVIKSLGDYMGDLPGISGATVLGDGSIALILDVPTLVKQVAV
ncbi:MAG: two-component system, chemotaxis family, sensor kinase CheA [Eubacteriales bacterium]|nr:two-component system, chemotaxis family, sensor kinase CheA [Eubacteriales bacterium]